MLKEITVQDLQQLINSGQPYQLIDVREEYEREISNLNGLHIPLNQILQRHDEVATDRQVVIHCRSGARSATAINLLQQHHGFDNLYNLKGGILAWSDQIDPSLPKY